MKNRKIVTIFVTILTSIKNCNNFLSFISTDTTEEKHSDIKPTKKNKTKTKADKIINLKKQAKPTITKKYNKIKKKKKRKKTTKKKT